MVTMAPRMGGLPPRQMMAQPVAYQNIPKLAPSFQNLMRMVVDAYKRMGRPVPPPDDIAKIARGIAEDQAGAAAAPLGRSPTGVVNPTRGAFEGQMISRLKTPDNTTFHYRPGKVEDALGFDTRDYKKIPKMLESGMPGQGLSLATRMQSRPGPLIPSEQAAFMGQFPERVIHGTQTVPASLTSDLQKAIEAFATRAGRAPSDQEVVQIISQIAKQKPQSALDMLSFPGAKAGAPNVAAQEVGALARAGESGALAELAKTAGKAAGVKGPAAEEALTRAILQRQATGPRKSSLDYLTALPTKQGKNLEALAEQMQKKKLLDEVKKLLKK